MFSYTGISTIIRPNGGIQLIHRPSVVQLKVTYLKTISRLLKIGLSAYPIAFAITKLHAVVYTYFSRLVSHYSLLRRGAHVTAQPIDSDPPKNRFSLGRHEDDR